MRRLHCRSGPMCACSACWWASRINFRWKLWNGWAAEPHERKKCRASFNKTAKINEHFSRCSIFGAWIKHAVGCNAHADPLDAFFSFSIPRFIIIQLSQFGSVLLPGKRRFTNPIALLYKLTTFSHYAMTFVWVWVRSCSTTRYTLPRRKFP